MSKLSIQLYDPHQETHGDRLRIIEDPDIDEPITKTKARLKDRRRNSQADQIADTDKVASAVRVRLANWLGRRERGIDPY